MKRNNFYMMMIMAAMMCMASVNVNAQGRRGGDFRGGRGFGKSKRGGDRRFDRDRGNKKGRRRDF